MVGKDGVSSQWEEKGWRSCCACRQMTNEDAGEACALSMSPSLKGAVEEEDGRLPHDGKAEHQAPPVVCRK